MERSAQRYPSFRASVLVVLLLLLAPSLAGQNVRLTARLESSMLSPGDITLLSVAAEFPPDAPSEWRQIARWRVDLVVSDPQVAGLRFDERIKPGADGLSAASPGSESGPHLLGIGDSLYQQPGAGRTGPVELLRIPVTAHATGSSRFDVEVSQLPSSLTLLADQGLEIPAPDGVLSGSATLQVRGDPEVILKSVVRTEVIPRLEAQEFRIRFAPATHGPLFVEDSPQPGGPWFPLPGGPHSAGIVIDSERSPARFYRVRSDSPSEVPRMIAIEHHPTWGPGASETVIDFDALSGWMHAVEFQEAGRTGWTPWPAGPFAAGPVRFADTTVGRSYRVTARPRVDRSTFDAFLVAGQSNGLLMDYDHPEPVTNAWRFDGHGAFVPLTQPAPGISAPFTYAFPVAAADHLAIATRRKTLILPCAIGSTTIDQWMPAHGRLDPGTCFGNANLRRLRAAPHGLKAVWYAGHEGDMLDPGLLDRYEEHWAALIRAFRIELGPVPILYTQAAKLLDAAHEPWLHAGAEAQRRLESGQPAGLPNHHLVVTFDLPLHDNIHLSSAAHRILGRRFALATRQHVYGESINGTGPRLIDLRFDPADRSRVLVRFNRPIRDSSNGYDGQFRAYAGERELELLEARRGADASTVLLRTVDSSAGAVSVSYGDRPAAAPGILLTQVVQDDEGLPAPQFGPLPVE